MRNDAPIIKPLIKNTLRRTIGKEFYCCKRKIRWLTFSGTWAKTISSDCNGFEIFQHQSMILRKLKDVDMYLQENKRVNLKLASSKIDGILIKPGETFSFWKLVGRPSKRKGYLKGLVLHQGKIQSGTGGGLCQLSNLLFWIFAHSPLTITERHRHSYDVFPDSDRKVPFGAGATLTYNYIDLQVRNDTPFTFQIRLWQDNTFLSGKLLCLEPLNSVFSIEERNHSFRQQSWGGYSRHNQIYRIETDLSGEQHETLLAENHALLMYSPFLKPLD
jgi:vancomycin resistance protein VanW